MSMSSMKRIIALVLVVGGVGVAGGVVGTGSWGELSERLESEAGRVLSHFPRTEAPLDDSKVAEARQSLRGLETAPMSGEATYDRKQFGQKWKDIDRNGCDQRNDALRRADENPRIKPGTQECVVLATEFTDPYTGKQVSFHRGDSMVDIDHVVPLSRAWQQGADRWDERQRERFANSEMNLVAVEASVNRSKGDQGPEDWMPPSGKCAYVVRWVEVKSEFELSVTDRERNVLENQLEQCSEGAGA